MRMILVPLAGTDSDNDEARLDAAFTIARRFNAHVEVLHVRPNPAQMLRTTSMIFPDTLRQSVLEVGERQAEELAAQARSVFDGYCQRNMITILDKPPMAEGISAAWFESTGRESVAVALRGRLTDLILLERPLEAGPTPETLEAALMETGKPLLILPPPERRPSAETIGRNIVIGWDGSAVAAKAVAAARHFLITADRVTVLSVRESKEGRLGVDDLIDHLAWHGVMAGSRLIESRRGDIGETLLAAAREREADMLVLGGYGTSMTRELILGGVTRHMLAHAEIPLLMVH